MTTHSRITRMALTIVIAVGAALIAPGPAAAARSDCPSGYFCVWTGTNYSGTIQRINVTNSYRAINLNATRSYYNNRSQRTWLHSSATGGGSTQCINPGRSSGSTSGWQASAKAAYLATVTSC